MDKTKQKTTNTRKPKIKKGFTVSNFDERSDYRIPEETGTDEIENNKRPLKNEESNGQ